MKYTPKHFPKTMPDLLAIRRVSKLLVAVASVMLMIATETSSMPMTMGRNSQGKWELMYDQPKSFFHPFDEFEEEEGSPIMDENLMSSFVEPLNPGHSPFLLDDEDDEPEEAQEAEEAEESPVLEKMGARILSLEVRRDEDPEADTSFSSNDGGLPHRDEEPQIDEEPQVDTAGLDDDDGLFRRNEDPAAEALDTGLSSSNNGGVLEDDSSWGQNEDVSWSDAQGRQELLHQVADDEAVLDDGESSMMEPTLPSLDQEASGSGAPIEAAADVSYVGDDPANLQGQDIFVGGMGFFAHGPGLFTEEVTTQQTIGAGYKRSLIRDDIPAFGFDGRQAAAGQAQSAGAAAGQAGSGSGAAAAGGLGSGSAGAMLTGSGASGAMSGFGSSASLRAGADSGPSALTMGLEARDMHLNDLMMATAEDSSTASWYETCGETTEAGCADDSTTDGEVTENGCGMAGETDEGFSSTDEIYLSSTDESCLLSTDGSNLLSTDGSNLPSTDESCLPSTDGGNLLSTDGSNLPSMDESYLPSMDESCLPSTVESYSPSADESFSSTSGGCDGGLFGSTPVLGGSSMTGEAVEGSFTTQEGNGGSSTGYSSQSTLDCDPCNEK